MTASYRLVKGPTTALPTECAVRLIFADVFVPDGGIFLNIVGKERDTFLGVEVEDFDVERAEPVDAALESTAFADDDASKVKLPNQAAAIPAGS